MPSASSAAMRPRSLPGRKPRTAAIPDDDAPRLLDGQPLPHPQVLPPRPCRHHPRRRRARRAPRAGRLGLRGRPPHSPVLSVPPRTPRYRTLVGVPLAPPRRGVPMISPPPRRTRWSRSSPCLAPPHGPRWPTSCGVRCGPAGGSPGWAAAFPACFHSWRRAHAADEAAPMPRNRSPPECPASRYPDGTIRERHRRRRRPWLVAAGGVVRGRATAAPDGTMKTKDRPPRARRSRRRRMPPTQGRRNVGGLRDGPSLHLGDGSKPSRRPRKHTKSRIRPRANARGSGAMDGLLKRLRGRTPP